MPAACCTVALNNFSIITAVSPYTQKNVYTFYCPEHGCPQVTAEPASLMLTLQFVTFMAPRIWRWLLDIWKICGPLHCKDIQLR